MNYVNMNPEKLCCTLVMKQCTPSEILWNKYFSLAQKHLEKTKKIK